MEKRCSTCGNVFDISNFYRCGKTKSGKTRYANECIECRKKREKERYDTFYNEMKKYRTKCAKCGESKWYLLEFHHKEPEEKEFNISQWRKREIKLAIEEIKKCDVLCKNCHAEFHFLNRENGISYDEYINNF